LLVAHMQANPVPKTGKFASSAARSPSAMMLELEEPSKDIRHTGLWISAGTGRDALSRGSRSRVGSLVVFPAEFEFPILLRHRESRAFTGGARNLAWIEHGSCARDPSLRLKSSCARDDAKPDDWPGLKLRHYGRMYG
jgi:hypothetical protein